MLFRLAVKGFIDTAHAALTELFDNAIPPGKCRSWGELTERKLQSQRPRKRRRRRRLRELSAATAAEMAIAGILKLAGRALHGLNSMGRAMRLK